MKQLSLLLILGGVMMMPVTAEISAIAMFMQENHEASGEEDAMYVKVRDGEASPAEVKSLREGYEALLEEAPPKGSESSWEKRVTKLVEAVKAIEAGEEKGVSMYKKAVNCRACHQLHKP